MPEKRIHVNIEEFAKKLIDFISSGPKEGKPAILKSIDTPKEDFSPQLSRASQKEEPPHPVLLKAIEKAKTRYDGKWSLQSHDRGQCFVRLVKDIKEYPYMINRQQAILTFLNGPGWEIDGPGWDTNSGNTFLMYELINATGYEKTKEETDSYLHKHVVFPLAKQLCEYIRMNVGQQEAVLKMKTLEEQKLESMREVKPLDLANVILFDNGARAKEYKILHPQINVFCLTFAPDSKAAFPWQLTWYDLSGNPNYLPVGSDLRTLLAKEKELPSSKTDLYDQIKVCCNKLLGTHSNVYLFDDEKIAGNFALQHPEKQIFCLTILPSAKNVKAINWQLNGYDIQGKPTYFNLEGELGKLLMTIAKLPSSEKLMHYKIKTQCLKLMESLLSKVQLNINTENTSPNGYSLQLMYKTIPDNSTIEPAKLYLYLIGNVLEFALKNKQGTVIRTVLNEEFAEKEGIIKILHDLSGELSHKQEKEFFNIITKQGFRPAKQLNSTFVMTTLYGYKLQLMYEKKPDDNSIETNKLYLYVIGNALEYAVKNKQGIIIRTVIHEEFAEKEAIIKMLHDVSGNFTDKQEKELFNITAKHGFKPFKHLNPGDDPGAVTQQDTPDFFQLDWYDSLGVMHAISLDQYPVLKSWLDGVKKWDIETETHLKTYLMHLNIRREVDDVKQNCVGEVLQKKHGITLIAVNNLAKIPPYKLIAGTYFLTREPMDQKGNWVLYQRQKGGINKQINTRYWESFKSILGGFKLELKYEKTPLDEEIAPGILYLYLDANDNSLKYAALDHKKQVIRAVLNNSLPLYNDIVKILHDPAKDNKLSSTEEKALFAVISKKAEAFLAVQDETMPDELSIPIKNQLRESITNALEMEKIKQVNQSTLALNTTVKAALSADGKTINKIKQSDFEEVTNFLKSRYETIKLMKNGEQPKKEPLSAEGKPITRIQLANYNEISNLFAAKNRIGLPENEEKQAHKELNSQGVELGEGRANCKKIDKNRIAGLQMSLFGPRASPTEYETQMGEEVYLAQAQSAVYD